MVENARNPLFLVPAFFDGEGGWPKASRVGLSPAIEAPPPVTSFASLAMCPPHEWEG
jgi:hypothetical protein